MLIWCLTRVDVHFHTRPQDFAENHRSPTTQGISFLMQTCDFLGHKCHAMTIFHWSRRKGCPDHFNEFETYYKCEKTNTRTSRNQLTNYANELEHLKRTLRCVCHRVASKGLQKGPIDLFSRTHSAGTGHCLDAVVQHWAFQFRDRRDRLIMFTRMVLNNVENDHDIIMDNLTNQKENHVIDCPFWWELPGSTKLSKLDKLWN